MNMNGTQSSNITAAGDMQGQTADRVTGQSAFWAMASLTLYTASQPSLCGSTYSGSIFAGLLSPHRSSPFVGVVEGVLELMLAYCDLRRRIRAKRSESPGQQQVPSNPTAAVVRILVLVAGVLPQAVKLFAMRGIVFTQIWAALLLFSATASLMRSLTVTPTPRQAHLTADKEALWRVRFQYLFGFGALLPHAVLIIIVWFHMEPHIHLDVKIWPFGLLFEVIKLLKWLVFACALYMTQHMLVTLIYGRWLAPRLPFVVALQYLDFPTLSRLFRSQHNQQLPGERWPEWTHRLLLSTYMAAICFTVAFGLQRCSRLLSRRPTTDESPDHNTSDVAEASPEDNNVASIPVIVGRRGSQDAAYDIGLSSRVLMIEDSTSVVRPESSDAADLLDIPPHLRGHYKQAIGLMAAVQHVSDLEDLSTTACVILFCANFGLLGPGIKVLAYSKLISNRTDSVVDMIKFEEQMLAQDAPLGNALPQIEPSVAELETPEIRAGWELFRFYISQHRCRPPRFIVRWLCILLFRVVKAFRTLYGHAFFSTVRFLRQLAKEHGEDTIWLAFGVLNCLTGAVYYLHVFDGTHTSAPGWTKSLG